MQESRLNRRWDLLILSLLVYTCLGTIYSWSVFRGPLSVELGLGSEQLGRPYSTFLGAFAFSMPATGWLMKTIGHRTLLAAGGLLVGAGWIAAGAAASLEGLTVSYGLLGGIGVGLGYAVPLAVVASWFPDRRGSALGIALAGFGMSPFVTAPLGGWLIGTMGVRAAMTILGSIFAVVVLGAAPLFRARTLPQRQGSEASGDMGPSDALRSPAFWALWLSFGVGTAVGLTAIGITATYASDVVGMASGPAAILVAVFGLLNGAGRPLFGAIHDRHGPATATRIAFCAVAAAAALALLSGPGRVLFLVLAFGGFWTMLGGWLAIAPAATGRLFGASTYAQNYGLMYTAYGVGALGGGALADWLLRASGSYQPLFLAMLLLAGLGAVFAPGALRPAAQAAAPS